MSADVKSQSKNNNSLAFTFRLNKKKKAPTQEGGLARALMQKKIAKKVVTDQSTNNSSEKINMAESVRADTATSTKKACICAPTSHAGSFRCRFHRAKKSSPWNAGAAAQDTRKRSFASKTTSSSSIRTNGDGQPGLSRFTGAACESLPLTMAP